MIAAIADGTAFAKGRDFAAWLGFDADAIQAKLANLSFIVIS